MINNFHVESFCDWLFSGENQVRTESPNKHIFL